VAADDFDKGENPHSPPVRRDGRGALGLFRAEHERIEDELRAPRYVE
jgi:hypothetical protein